MMDFMSFLDEAAGKKKDENPFAISTTMMQHPTGFMYLDYGCGSYLNVYDDDENPLYTYHNIGISSGSVNSVIAKSQGGKTTLAIQMANAIIEPYMNSRFYERFISENVSKKEKEALTNALPFVQIIDTEKTLPMDYVKKLTHLSNKAMAKRILINQITTDTELISLVEKHIKYKTTYMKPTVCPILDVYGKPLKEYPPTVIIIDSMTQLLLSAVDEDNVDAKKGGLQDVYDSSAKGMAGAQRARVIGTLYSQLVDLAGKFNIIIFSINHINKMPAVMGIPVKQVRWLKSSETIAGGERPLYLTSSVLRLDVIKSIGYGTSTSVDLGEDIKGFITLANWAKCKTNSKGNTCQLAFTNRNGYDPLLSNLWNAKETGDLHKKGNFYYVDGFPDKPFTFKTYQQVFIENPELITALYDQLRDSCAKMLDNPEVVEEQNRKLIMGVRDDIHQEYENGELSRSEAMDEDDLFAGLMND